MGCSWAALHGLGLTPPALSSPQLPALASPQMACSLTLQTSTKIKPISSLHLLTNSTVTGNSDKFRLLLPRKIAEIRSSIFEGVSAAHGAPQALTITDTKGKRRKTWQLQSLNCFLICFSIAVF